MGRYSSNSKTDGRFIWGTIWYGLLAIMSAYSLKYGYFSLSVAIAVVLLCAYGFLVFSKDILAGSNHTYTKPHPWLILGLGLMIGFTGDRWWLVKPSFQTVPAEQSPFELPLRIDGVELGMTQDAVRQLLGEPETIQRYYLGKIEELAQFEAAYLAAGLKNLASAGRENLHIDDPQTLSEFTSRDIETQEIERESKRRVHELTQEVKEGRTFRIAHVDVPLDFSTSQQALRTLGEIREPGYLLLLTSASESSLGALLMERPSPGTLWSYEDKGLAIVFGSVDGKDTVRAVSGREVSIEDRSWSRVGEPLNTLNTPGRPLRTSPAKLIENNFVSKYEKDWGEARLLVGTDFGSIERIEIRAK